jgi:CDP-diacylglycerol---glycerol-3-phosphate 3-phosphatidyltransferase
MANLLTLGRVLLIFVIIGVWNRQIYPQWWQLDLLMVPLLAWAIIMDALDGWVARKRREESEAGALIDIAGDRIVELALWVFFAVRRDALGTPFVPLWVPLVMIARTVLTDLVRSVALRDGRMPFGEQTLHESWWAKEVVSSRWSRAAYGVIKAVAFCALGIALAWERLQGFTLAEAAWRLVTEGVVYATVAIALIRGLPVLWEGRRFVLRPPSAGFPATRRSRRSAVLRSREGR